MNCSGNTSIYAKRIISTLCVICALGFSGVAASTEQEGEGAKSAQTQKSDTLKSERLKKAESLNKQLIKLYQQGRYAEAIALGKETLAIREKALGPDHPDTAKSLNNLAALYRAQGSYAKAEPLLERALVILEKVLGSDHPDTATILNNLALLYESQGMYGKAEPLYERVLAIREKALGPDHPDTANSLNSQATLYHAQGKYTKAEPLYERALAIREKALGPDHPDTATSLNNLAGLYDAQGAYAKAEPLYKRALTIYEKVLGPDHPLTANSLNNLAALYHAQGAYAKAEPLCKRALAIREKALGPDHPDTATSLNNLAELYRVQGAYAKAEPLYKRALAIREKSLGPDHPDTAASLNNLAGLYDDQGAYAKAEPLYKRALAIYEKVLGPDHPLTANSLNNLASLYYTQGAYAKAEPLLERALAITEKALGPDHPDTWIRMNNLLNTHTAQSHWKPAFPLSVRLVQHQIDQLTVLGNLKKTFTEAEDSQLPSRDLMPQHLRILTALGKLSEKDATLAFEALQLAHDPRNTQIMIKTALKLAGNDPEHKAMIEGLQDALYRQQAADKHYIDTLSNQGPDAAKLQQIARDNLDKAKKQVEQTYQSLRKNWQAFDVLADPKPLPVKETQALLKPNEALLAYLTDKDQSYLIVVRKNGFKLHKLEMGSDELSTAIGSLTNAMYRPKNQIRLPNYDLDIAYQLYQKLIAPAKAELQGAEDLIIVTDRTLQSLPFAALITQPPPKADPLTGAYSDQHYAQAAWLIKDYSLSRLPNVAALGTIREKKTGQPAKEAFIGFGDPVLQGKEQKEKPSTDPDQKTVKSHTGSDPADAFFGARVLSLFRDGEDIASVEALNTLDPLPGTGAELKTIARIFKADDPKHLYLQQRATETELKTLNQQGVLKNQRIIAFATHALQAGDISDLPESGLVFTPPDKPDEHDDGYLTAIEVSRLKLNADWVLLSACNTGTVVSDQADSEPNQSDNLSALAKSFFLAGSRNLLVTQWKVDDETGRQLMSDLFAQPDANKAQALRQAMLKVITEDVTPTDRKYDGCQPGSWGCIANAWGREIVDNIRGLFNDQSKTQASAPNRYAHPAYWAPYRVLGVGG